MDAPSPVSLRVLSLRFPVLIQRREDSPGRVPPDSECLVADQNNLHDYPVRDPHALAPRSCCLEPLRYAEG